MRCPDRCSLLASAGVGPRAAPAYSGVADAPGFGWGSATFGVAGGTPGEALPAVRGAVQGVGELHGKVIADSGARSVAPDSSVAAWAALSAPVLALRPVGPVADSVRERVDERGMVKENKTPQADVGGVPWGAKGLRTK